jgi:hypothetical protein
MWRKVTEDGSKECERMKGRCMEGGRNDG